MTRRATGRALYQVDLIAALFSGFIVVWLTTASDSDAPPDESPGYVSVEIVRNLVSSRPGLWRTAWVPQSALRAGCPPPTTVLAIAAASPSTFGGNRSPCVTAPLKIDTGPDFSAVLDHVRTLAGASGTSSVVEAAAMEIPDNVISLPASLGPVGPLKYFGVAVSDFHDLLAYGNSGKQLLSPWSNADWKEFEKHALPIDYSAQRWGDIALATVTDPSVLLAQSEIIVSHKSARVVEQANEFVYAAIRQTERSFFQREPISLIGASAIIDVRFVPPLQAESETVRLCVLDDPIVCFVWSGSPDENPITLKRVRS